MEVTPENLRSEAKLVLESQSFKREVKKVQDKSRGLGDAFIIGENFIGDDNVTFF